MRLKNLPDTTADGSLSQIPFLPSTRLLFRLWLLAVALLVFAAIDQAQASVEYDWLLSGKGNQYWQPPTTTAVAANATAPDSSTDKLFDNSGMSGTAYPQDTHDSLYANMWMSPAYTSSDTSYKYVQIDLGASYPLGKMLVWNFNKFQSGVSWAGRGVRLCYIGYSNDGVNFTWLDGGYGYGGLFQLAKAPGTSANFAATNQQGTDDPIDFKGGAGRYVRIWLRSNWGGASGDGSSIYYGLSELRVYRYASSVNAAGDFIAAKALESSSAGYYPADATTNNFGMSDSGSGTYATSATTDTAGGWYSALNDPAPFLLYDLGGTYPLSKLYVWNFNVYYYLPLWGRGIKNASIWYSVTKNTFDWHRLDGPNPDKTWTFAAASSTSGQGYTSAIDFNNTPVRYVKIVPNVGLGNGNWGGAYGDTQPYYGLGQVRFYAGPGTVAEPSPRWTGMTGQRSSTTAGWGGADGGYSIPYHLLSTGQSRSLFTYSDTFNDTWNATSYNRGGSGFINNSNAVWSGTATLNPSVANMAFDVSHSVIPTPSLFPAACGTSSACNEALDQCVAACAPANTAPCLNACQPTPQFYWLMGGVYLNNTQQGQPFSPPRIYFFGQRFQFVGGTVGPPATVGTLVQRGGSVISVDAGGTSGSGINWSTVAQYDTAAYYVDEAANVEYSFAHEVYMAEDELDGYDFLYIYGVKATHESTCPFGECRYGLVARVASRYLTSPSQWRFYDGTNWVAGVTNAAPITGCDAVTGCDFGLTASVNQVSGGFQMTTMKNTIGSVQISTAANPWGPFTTWTTLYSPPENNVDWFDGGVWWYTATNHPELAPSGESLISYSVNEPAKDPNVPHIPYINDSDVYHPRYVRVRNIQ